MERERERARVTIVGLGKLGNKLFNASLTSINSFCVSYASHV